MRIIGKRGPALLAAMAATRLAADFAITGFAITTNGVDFTMSATNHVFPDGVLDCYSTPSLVACPWRWIDSAPTPAGDTNGYPVFVANDKFAGPGDASVVHDPTCSATTNIYTCPFFSGAEVTNVAWNCGHGTTPPAAFFFFGDRTDTDDDGLPDAYENHVLNTNAGEPDTDHDEISDFEELLHGLNPTNYFDTIEDFDDDGLPNVFEYFNGTNPFVADYDDAPRIIAGTNAALGELSLSNAFAASTQYSVIEVRPGRYSGPEWTGLAFPPHPVLLTSTNGFNNHDTVIRAPDENQFVFALGGAQDLHTIVQGLTIDLHRDSSAAMAAFRMEPAATGEGSGGYFRNMHVRLSNNGTGRGWWVDGPSSNALMIANSIVEFMPGRTGQAVCASNPPPMFIDGCTLLHSSGSRTSRALYLRRTDENTPLQPLAVKNTILDATFLTNRCVYPLSAQFPLSFVNCIVPENAILATTNLHGIVWTNLLLRSDAMPPEGCAAFGGGAEYSHVATDISGLARGDPPAIGAREWCVLEDNGRDTDGDGLPDYAEVFTHGTSPWFADTDGDGVDDGHEVANGADPLVLTNFCADVTVSVTNTSGYARELSLSLRATSAANTGVVAVATAYCGNAEFPPVHVVVSNSTAKTAFLFDDLDANGVFDASDLLCASKSFTITNHDPRVEISLGSIAFDKDNDDIPDWWELSHGLSNTNRLDALEDPDGDGLPNFQECYHGLDPYLADGSNTVFAVASRSIDDRIAGKNPTNALPAFINYPACGTNLLRNTDCWAYGIDLSCASPWHSPTTYAAGNQNTATLISPRHFVTANHYAFSLNNNTVLYFMGTNDVVYSNHMTAHQCVGNTDIHIGLLATEMTNACTIAKVLPQNYTNYLPNVKGLPIFTFDQEEKALVCELDYLDLTNIHIRTCSTYNRQLFNETAVGGDSSSPWFMLLGGQTILLTTYHWPTSGPWVDLFRAEIQATMNQLAPGYVLQEADLSSFNELTTP